MWSAGTLYPSPFLYPSGLVSIVTEPSPIAIELWESLGPWYRKDLEDPERPLLQFCQAFIGGLQRMEDVIRDSEDGPGWSIILDPDRAPAQWLPWLKQWAGLVNYHTDMLPEQSVRDLIKDKPVQRRGSPQAMIDEVKKTLTGTKTVYLQERAGSAYLLTVATLASETPDPAATERAALNQKPAGIIMTVVQIVGGDYLTLASTHSDYADIASSFGTYAEIPLDPSA